MIVRQVASFVAKQKTFGPLVSMFPQQNFTRTRRSVRKNIR